MEFKISNNNDLFYYGDDEENILAFVSFNKLENNKYNINKVFVDDSLRGKGVAGELMKKFTNYAEENNIKLEATCSYAINWLEKNYK